MPDLKHFDYVLIDGMNLAYRTWSIPVKHQGKKSGLFFGFMSKVVGWVNRGAQVYVLWEGGNNRRSELFPLYKANRKRKIDPVFQENLNAVCKCLPLVSASQYTFPLEADDLADYLCRSVLRGAILLLTNDQDWMSLLQPGRVEIENGQGRLTYEQAQDKLGFSPSKLPLYKAVRGCRTDNVPQAVKRIGEKALVDMVNSIPDSNDLETLIYLLEKENIVDKTNIDNVYSNYEVVSLLGEYIRRHSEEICRVPPHRDRQLLESTLIDWGCYSILGAVKNKRRFQ